MKGKANMYVTYLAKVGGLLIRRLTAVLRTDESFRNRDQLQLHAGLSISENFPINMADSFCIDPMHLVYMGVMRKLLFVWVHGRKSMKVRLSLHQMNEISNILVRTEAFITVEFSRKTRTLNYHGLKLLFSGYSCFMFCP